MKKRDRALRNKELLRITGTSRSTVWRLEQEGMFPKRFKIGKRGVAWSENEVMEWLSTRPVVELGVNV